MRDSLFKYGFQLSKITKKVVEAQPFLRENYNLLTTPEKRRLPLLVSTISKTKLRFTFISTGSGSSSGQQLVAKAQYVVTADSAPYSSTFILPC